MIVCVDNNFVEVGIDEAGRGSLAGNVYASAVILPKEFDDNLYLQINDSKKLSRKKRSKMERYIKEVAIDYGIGYATNIEIDKMNILNASILAMHRALDNLKVVPDKLYVDGTQFKPYLRDGDWIEYSCVPKGDTKYYNIAAASILAKEAHDRHIIEISKIGSNHLYDWENNMSYGTVKHKQAIKEYGITEFHRKSYKL